MLETARTCLSASSCAKVQLWRSSLRRDVGALSRDTRLLAGFRLRARRGGFGGVSVFTAIDVITLSPFSAVITAVTTSIALVRRQAKCDGKSGLKRRAGEMGSAWAARPAQLLPEKAV